MDYEKVEVEVEYLADVKQDLEMLQDFKNAVEEVINSELEDDDKLDRITQAVDLYNEEKPIYVI